MNTTHRGLWNLSPMAAAIAAVIAQFVAIGPAWASCGITVGTAASGNIAITAGNPNQAACSGSAGDAVLNNGDLQGLIGSASTTVQSGDSFVAVQAPVGYSGSADRTLALSAPGLLSFSGNASVTATGQGRLNGVLSGDAGVSFASGAGFTTSNGTLSIRSASGGAQLGALNLNFGTLVLGTLRDVTQVAPIIAAGLSGSVGGNVTLDNPGNVITGLGNFRAGGSFTLASSAALSVSGDLTAASVNFSGPGSVNVSGSITTTAGQTIGALMGNGTLTLQSGTLTTGASNADTVFSGSIGGGGGLLKQGLGTLTLDGPNSFTGPTLVQAGKLVVGSSESAASAQLAGDVDVAGGATLGGHGTIGGNVSLQAGAHLAPGNSIGRLNIEGNYTSAQGSVLDFEFGVAAHDIHVPGQSDNVQVGGDLALNGATLNVIDAGGLGPGFYNLFSYYGTLTLANGGITLGSTPPGSFALQSDTRQQQINLVNATGASLNIWNADQQASDSQMGGGSGTWSTTAANWTNILHNVNAAMQPLPGFAVFGGAPGVVTLDDSAGAVTALGIQFASSGYVLGGGPLTLVADATHPAPVELRVGDGSAASAGWTASIDSDILGSDGLVKTGAGTLVLTGNNTYAGGTAVRDGVLQVRNDSNLGAPAAGVTLDGGTLRAAQDFITSRPYTLGAGGGTFDLPGTALTPLGPIDGAGALTVTGQNGRLLLEGPNSYSGGTTIRDGVTVRVSGAGTLGTGAVQLQGSGANLEFTGASNAGANSYTVGRSGSADSANTMAFFGTASAASALIDVNGAGNLLRFHDSASAGSAHIGVNGGATVYFEDTPTAAGARIANGAGSTVDVSGVSAGTGIGIGSLSGAGAVVLGAARLTLGALNGDDRIDGVVSDTGGLFMPAGTGSGGALVKTGTGTLTLTGANSYTGGTALQQGRLDLGSNSALGSGTLAMDDGTTLGFSADGLNIANALRLTGTHDPVIDTGAFDEVLSGGISGAGAITKQGTGTLTLSGANTYTGATDVAQGTLRAGAAHTFSAASAHTVETGATLDLAGFDQTVASLANSGTVSLTGSAPGTTLTVTGNYVGNNGVLRLGTALNANGPSDRLVLDGPGASASGRTSVQVTNLGGLGASTLGNGIEVIGALNGATTTAQTTKDAFSLAGGSIAAGAFEYRLYAADANGAGENWYLRSSVETRTPAPVGTPTTSGTPGSPDGAATPLAPAAPVATSVVAYRPEVSLYASLPAQLRQSNLSMLGNLRLRAGDDDVKGAAPASTGPDRRAWGRVLTADLDIGQGGAVSPTSKGQVSGFQAGIDLLATPHWRAGLYVGQLDGDAKVDGFASGIADLRVGRNDLRNQYFGAYGTYANDSGFYADAVVQAGRHRATVSPLLGGGTELHGRSLLTSIEIGQAFAMGDTGWTVEPQLRLIHQHLSLDDAPIPGAVVQSQADSGWIARVGVRVKGRIDTRLGALQPYARLNVYKASSGTDVARFVNAAAVTDIRTPTGGTSTEAAAGFTLTLGPTTSLYAEAGKLWATGGNTQVRSAINGSLGLRVKW